MFAALVVFVALFALDFVWVGYTRAVTAHGSLRAGLYAAVLIVLSGTAAHGYVLDPWLLIPAALGAFTGTYSAMRWTHR